MNGKGGCETNGGLKRRSWPVKCPMGMGPFASELIALVDNVDSPDELHATMARISRELGFQYFALSQHVDMATTRDQAFRLHNYPAAWQDYYDAHRLSVSDPVHRASHVTCIGFTWSRLPEMIALTPRDRQILSIGRAQGIGDGFTVPANVPGEARGSCSFANQAGRPLPDAALPFAQLVGAFGFEAARRFWMPRRNGSRVPLTDRQRDCVLWAARGKSDWEISRILGVSEETVARHLKGAFCRYGVNKRTLLAIRALFDGTISFTDIFKR